MRFQIAGKRYEVGREDVVQAMQSVAPAATDGRHIYFVKIRNRHYPIKQVVQLATGLRSAEFTSQHAFGMLNALGFEVSGRPSMEARLSDEPVGYGEGLRLLVVFETDEDGWIVASCPTLPGCHSQGRTRDEALANIREAIGGYLASMREHGDPPPPSTEYAVVEATA